MWLGFAPPVVRWLAFGLFVLAVIGYLVMPRAERERLRRSRRRRALRRSITRGPATGHHGPQMGDVPEGAWSVMETSTVPTRSLRRLEGAAWAAQILLGVLGVAVLALIAWLVFAALSSLPGWS